MTQFADILIERIQDMSSIEYFTFTINALVFVFSNQIARLHGEDDKTKTKMRLRILHSFNLVVFLSFILSIIVVENSYLDEQISESSLCLLIAYVFYNIADGLILTRYGEEITVMGSARTVETATSRTLELIVLTIILITSGITLINIWGITGILETTGAVGFLALLIFTTKDYWLNDFLSGILIISGNSAKRGDVISIPDLNVLGIIMEIGGLQTRVRDLAQGHDIEIPNNAMLNHRTDFYKDNPGGPHREFVDFNIGYGIESQVVEDFLNHAYKDAKNNSTGLDDTLQPIISLKENGNNAVRWRLTYHVSSPRHLLKIRDEINLSAYNLQEQYGIDLSTPNLERSVSIE
ncbi:MAG: hypothetical protein CMB18_04425 [Euryarchaeota archaeon]|nr:hypothetical protein [Euryarchaeota archaeon]|tara:strand:- start:2465 stop:3517 length:1053 start_codon:yes stop_codon:yes gene_type:complete